MTTVIQISKDDVRMFIEICQQNKVSIIETETFENHVSFNVEYEFSVQLFHIGHKLGFETARKIIDKHFESQL